MENRNKKTFTSFFNKPTGKTDSQQVTLLKRQVDLLERRVRILEDQLKKVLNETKG